MLQNNKVTKYYPEPAYAGLQGYNFLGYPPASDKISSHGCDHCCHRVISPDCFPRGREFYAHGSNEERAWLGVKGPVHHNHQYRHSDVHPSTGVYEQAGEKEDTSRSKLRLNDIVNYQKVMMDSRGDSSPVDPDEYNSPKSIFEKTQNDRKQIESLTTLSEPINCVQKDDHRVCAQDELSDDRKVSNENSTTGPRHKRFSRAEINSTTKSGRTLTGLEEDLQLRDYAMFSELAKRKTSYKIDSKERSTREASGKTNARTNQSGYAMSAPLGDREEPRLCNCSESYYSKLSAVRQKAYDEYMRSGGQPKRPEDKVQLVSYLQEAMDASDEPEKDHEEGEEHVEEEDQPQRQPWVDIEVFDPMRRIDQVRSLPEVTWTSESMKSLYSSSHAWLRNLGGESRGRIKNKKQQRNLSPRPSKLKELQLRSPEVKRKRNAKESKSRAKNARNRSISSTRVGVKQKKTTSFSQYLQEKSVQTDEDEAKTSRLRSLQDLYINQCAAEDMYKAKRFHGIPSSIGVRVFPEL